MAELTEGQRVVPAKEILDKIQKGEPVEYDSVIIEGDLDLTKLDLPTKHIELTLSKKLMGIPDIDKITTQIIIKHSHIDGMLNFRNILFLKEVNFTEAQFRGSASFDGAKFSGSVSFNGAKFSGTANFGSAQFRGSASFNRAKFNGEYTYFDVAKFSGDADFYRAQFRGYTYFSGAQFNGEYTNFSGAQFNGEYTYFSGAQFSGTVSFDEAHFRGEIAGFHNTQFNGDASLMEAQFSGTAYFDEAQFSQKLILNMVKYEQLHIQWEDIKEHLEYDGATYLTLIKNFRNLELFEDADSCYYQYRKISQSKKNWYKIPNRLIDLLILIHSEIISHLIYLMDPFVWLNKHRPFIWIHNFIHNFNWSKLGDHLSWISCGYGLKIWPMVIWITGAILIFAYVYNSYGGIVRDVGNTSPIDSFYFSIFALAGRTPPDNIHPVGLWRHVALLENLLGYVFLALFVVVLGRKVVR